jgi:opacity protein-like surface antigen
MKIRLKEMLATTAAAAALFAGAQVARADGMPAGPAYGAPAIWSGAYVGVESGWDWDRVKNDLVVPGVGSAPLGHWDRDVWTAGLFGGIQHQFGAVVVGAEFSIIGNQFDDGKNVTPIVGAGNCIAGLTNCVSRITDLITIGPRLGYAMGHFMPYVTGGFATGSLDFHAPCPLAPGGGSANCVGPGGNIPSGTDLLKADGRAYGYYIGGGLDWKLARNVVVGVEYRHVDLGSVDAPLLANPGGGLPLQPTGANVRMRGEEDSVMLRGSLLFGRDYAPLK